MQQTCTSSISSCRGSNPNDTPRNLNDFGVDATGWFFFSEKSQSLPLRK